MQCTKYAQTTVLVTTPTSNSAAAFSTTGTAAAPFNDAASNAARSASSVIGIPSPNYPCGASTTTLATKTCSSQMAIRLAYSAAVAEVCFLSKSLANYKQMSVATLLSEPVVISFTISFA
jgi:hypothetical protein